MKASWHSRRLAADDDNDDNFSKEKYERIKNQYVLCERKSNCIVIVKGIRKTRRGTPENKHGTNSGPAYPTTSSTHKRLAAADDDFSKENEKE